MESRVSFTCCSKWNRDNGRTLFIPGLSLQVDTPTSSMQIPRPQCIHSSDDIIPVSNFNSLDDLVFFFKRTVKNGSWLPRRGLNKAQTFIRRHHAVSNFNSLDDLVFFVKRTVRNGNWLAGHGLNKVQTPLRQGNHCIQELEMPFDLRCSLWNPSVESLQSTGRQAQSKWFQLAGTLDSRIPSTRLMSSGSEVLVQCRCDSLSYVGFRTTREYWNWFLPLLLAPVELLRPQYVYVGVVLVEIRLIYWRVTPFESLVENMRVALTVSD
jgi:hypothetical protein